MSPSVQLSVLALASTALAAGQHNRHAHLHRAASAPAPYPVPGGNSTGNAYPSSGLPDTCTESATPPSYPSPSGYASPSAYPSPSGYQSSSGVSGPSGYPSPNGYPSPSGYASPSGYPSPSSYASPSGYPSQSPSVVAPWTSGSPETCAPITVTATGAWTVTVTVTAGESSSESWSSSASTPTAYGGPPPSYGSDSSASQYQATSVTAAVANANTPSSSEAASVAPVVPTISVTPVPASSAPSSTASSSKSSGSGKRGLAYNNAALTSGFMGKSEVTWAYNWGSTPNGLGAGVEFIPLLHDGSSMFTDVWSVDAQTAINAGAKTLFAFNEPDAPSQANMSPADAAQVYMSYMQPFAGKAAICAPAVTNGEYTATGAPMGLNWLKEFLAECSSCTIDCLNIHWYASGPTAIQNFQDHLSQTAALAPGKSIWVSEFALSGASPADQQSFIETVMPMMDNNSDVAGYAYYWVDGALVEGDAPSNPLGTTYMSFVSGSGST